MKTYTKPSDKNYANDSHPSNTRSPSTRLPNGLSRTNIGITKSRGCMSTLFRESRSSVRLTSMMRIVAGPALPVRWKMKI